MTEWDLPEKIVEESINAQLRILSGYKGNPKTSRLKYFEASTPKHVAISLTGEPALYGPLGELIRLYHRRGFTTFLVSNGTVPSALKELCEEPKQFYISVCAPDKKTYASVCRPQITGAWERLAETLSLLPSCRSPTVIRMTLVSGLNMRNIKGYARLVEKANPTYIETKAYMHVGYSRSRLGVDCMPSHRDVRAFSESLSKETGYALVDESVESRVVLLSRLERPLKVDSG
jgi:tRNA wybutosine-synthesizing protein 1